MFPQRILESKEMHGLDEVFAFLCPTTRVSAR